MRKMLSFLILWQAVAIVLKRLIYSEVQMPVQQAVVEVLAHFSVKLH
jgi:hypothetical protein